jgi:hypothetical protein
MGSPGLKQLSIEVAELRLDINFETALTVVGSTFMSSGFVFTRHECRAIVRVDHACVSRGTLLEAVAA